MDWGWWMGDWWCRQESMRMWGLRIWGSMRMCEWSGQDDLRDWWGIGDWRGSMLQIWSRDLMMNDAARLGHLRPKKRIGRMPSAWKLRWLLFSRSIEDDHRLGHSTPQQGSGVMPSAQDEARRLFSRACRGAAWPQVLELGLSSLPELKSSGEKAKPLGSKERKLFYLIFWGGNPK